MNESTESVQPASAAAQSSAMQFYRSHNARDIVRAASSPDEFGLADDTATVLRAMVVGAVYRNKRSF